MFLSEWREFPSERCIAGKENLLTARVSMLLKLRGSLICFGACFLPGWAKDLSAPGRLQRPTNRPHTFRNVFTLQLNTLMSLKYYSFVSSKKRHTRLYRHITNTYFQGHSQTTQFFF